MPNKTIVILAAATMLAACQPRTRFVPPAPPPEAPVEVVTEDVFGATVEDPYRYMENMEDSVVSIWMEGQSDYARAVLDQIPGRQSLIDRMRDFDSRRSTLVSSLTITDNDRYFYLKRTPEDEVGKLFMRDGFEGEESLLFDPTSYGDTSLTFVVGDISPNEDGSKLAFTVSPNGSENATLLIMDVETSELSPEQIDRCWFPSASWLPDGNSFLYNRLQSADLHDPDREKDSKVYLHVVGTDPDSDRLILSREKYPSLGINMEDFPLAAYDKDNDHLFAYILTVDRRLKMFYAPASELPRASIAWKPFITHSDDIHNVYLTDTAAYGWTPQGAPNFKLVRTSLARPDWANAEVIVAESPDQKLADFALTNEAIYYTLTRNGVEASLFRLPVDQAEAVQLDLPIPASSIGVSSKGFKFSDVWASGSGWSTDSRRFRYHVDTDEFTHEQLSDVAEYPEYEDLVVEEVMVPSHDGVEVPLSIIYREGTPRDGSAPAFILGYGAYGASINPFFSPNRLLWTQEGGVLAVAHVRGGGELGDAWHKAGFKTTKPNTWKDAIACGEYLVDNGYTSPDKLTLNGGSAGGILVGRAMTERPDLFGVAIPEVGVMNALRAEFSPNGPVNAPEFGTISDPVEAAALIEMDAYLHLEDSTSYPATLLTAGMNDPRVIAWQPAKFAARLIAANVSDEPILFWTDYKSGHGIGDSKSKQWEGLADVYSFALWRSGHPRYQM